MVSTVTPITPKSNTHLFGHSQTQEMLIREFRAGRLAHGLIFSGVKGIGKATLAYHFARMLLSGREDMNLPETSPIFARIIANSHTDLLVVEPAYDEKKEEYATEISAEIAREIPKFLSLTPAEGAWRVVIIDSADVLNDKSANAILKILEEPPKQTILILIAHNVGRLLPTIRSRCRVVSLKPLSYDDFSQAVRLSVLELYGEELAMLAVMSAHSVGVALELHEKGALKLYNETLDLISSAQKLDNQAVLKFCEQIGSGKKAHGNWQLFMHITLCILERITKQAAGVESQKISDAETQKLQKIASLHNAEIWAEKWQQAGEEFQIAQKFHLDYKQVALVFFHSLL